MLTCSCYLGGGLSLLCYLQFNVEMFMLGGGSSLLCYLLFNVDMFMLGGGGASMEG